MHWSKKGNCWKHFLEQWGAKQGSGCRVCTSSFKARMVQKAGHREAYERGHGIPEQSDANFEEVPVICTVSHFWILE